LNLRDTARHVARARPVATVGVEQLRVTGSAKIHLSNPTRIHSCCFERKLVQAPKIELPSALAGLLEYLGPVGKRTFQRCPDRLIHFVTTRPDGGANGCAERGR